jgi:hypothetical protein
MIRGVLVVVSVLALSGASDPPSGTNAPSGSKPGAGAPALPEVQPSEALAKYNGLRAVTPETASAQWNLALWCEKNGLAAEAYVHFSAVIRLDPSRDAAWRKLGFRKQNGRWMNDNDLAEDAEQKKADKVWGPKLRKIHRSIHKSGKVLIEAEEALAAVEDPRAVPTIFREFGNGGARDQEVAVQALGHISSPLSSRLIAMLAIYGKSPEVRRRSVESLRSRDADDYLEFLVGLLEDTLKYEVRPVGGPGSPGVLYVEGQKFNVKRVYAAPAVPNVVPGPGDLVRYDQNGLPIIERPNVSATTYTPIPGASYLPMAGAPRMGRQDYVANTPVTRFAAGEAVLEAQRAARSSKEQLENDVADLEELNAPRKRFNELVISALKAASGKAVGDTPDAWRETLPKKKQYGEVAAKSPRKPTYDELIPSDYRPTFFVQSMATWVKNAPMG